jgi:predicted DNA-binding protein YlxM (UPF0122 family)
MAGRVSTKNLHILRDRRRKVSDLYLQHKKMAEIADIMSVSKPTVSRDIAHIEKEWVAAYTGKIEILKAKQLEELYTMKAIEWREREPGWTDRILRANEQINKLAGLYAPDRMQHTAPDGPVVVRIIYEDDVCQPSTTSGSNGHTQHNGASLQARLNGR